MTGADYRLILASRSPQRREILIRLGLEFEVVVPEVEEIAGGDPAADVLENARRKAAAVWGARGGGGGSAGGKLAAGAGKSAGAGNQAAGGGRSPVVLACDTDVVDHGRILGKPADAAEAREYLRRLSGREHEVISALVVLGLPELETPARGVGREGVARSLVRFRELSEERIEWYLGTGEWRGRAGGYAIQGFGTALIAGVEGDISNVIGLPVPVLVDIAGEILG